MPTNPYANLQPKTRLPYTEIYLIRHANPDYRLQEKLGDKAMPLSKAGEEQSKLLAKALKGCQIDVVYSSELTRAKETAKFLVPASKIIIEPRLNEIDWINWYRVKYFRTSESRRTQYLKNYQELDLELDKFQAQMRRLLAYIFKENKGKKVALVCHGNIIRSMLTSIINADVIGFLSIEIFQSSISKLVIDSDAYVKVSYINDFKHLKSQPSEDLFDTLQDSK